MLMQGALLVSPGAGAEAPREIHELLIEVGEVTVRALCTDGTRNVLLLHGAEASADTWIPVLERLDSRVGACAYDRAGSGGSGPDPAARGWYELLDELRRIHLALGFDEGYVLVGHELGGLYARLYAAERRDDVGALLLLDPAHEDLAARMQAGMPADAWRAWTRAMTRPNRDGVRQAEVGERARSARLSYLPVTVITPTVRRDGGGWDQRFVNEAARQVHESILRGVESPRHIPASRSGPNVQLDQPQLVADEILRLRRLAAR
jgi:pimeloyl-ACP methyl ester carboxylesterase